MRILKEIQLKLNNKDKIIFFGIPDNQQEMDEMHKLRYKVYSERNYIDKNCFKDEKEKDEYDENKSYHFIAKIDDRIIGTARLITDHYLPTEKDCFKFNEPKKLKKVPRENRAEISRLIVDKYDNDKNIYIFRVILLCSAL